MSVGFIAGKSDRRSFELENDLSYERGAHEIRIREGNSLVLFEAYIFIVKRIFFLIHKNNFESVESATRNTDDRR